MSTIGQSITGAKFYEVDDVRFFYQLLCLESHLHNFIQWFDKKKTYLDNLEVQLKALVKAIEAVSKQRAGQDSHLVVLGKCANQRSVQIWQLRRVNLLWASGSCRVPN